MNIVEKQFELMEDKYMFTVENLCCKVVDENTKVADARLLEDGIFIGHINRYEDENMIEFSITDAPVLEVYFTGEDVEGNILDSYEILKKDNNNTEMSSSKYYVAYTMLENKFNKRLVLEDIRTRVINNTRVADARVTLDNKFVCYISRYENEDVVEYSATDVPCMETYFSGESIDSEEYEGFVISNETDESKDLEGSGFYDLYMELDKAK